jgi:hypothetical protein
MRDNYSIGDWRMAVTDRVLSNAPHDLRLGFGITPCRTMRISQPAFPAPRPLVALRAPLLAAVLLAGCRTVDHGAASSRDAAERIRRDIAYLADDRLEGRATGTAGNDSAAAWLARRHEALRLRPTVADTTTGSCSDVGRGRCLSFLQRFTARGAELAHEGKPEGVRTQNVVAMVPGRDPARAGREVVVIGAHFDHLGRSPANALDQGNAIRNGADDNASGTAALLELARRFKARRRAATSSSSISPARSSACSALSGSSSTRPCRPPASWPW